MSVVKLRQKLEAVKLSSFKFSSFKREITVNDKGEKFTYLEFALVDPIAKVTRSMPLYDPQTRNRVYESKEDVMVIRCSMDDIEATETEWDFPEYEPGKIDPNNCLGSYNGDLHLDMSDAGICWVTSVPYSKMSGEFKNTAKSQRLQAALAKTAK